MSAPTPWVPTPDQVSALLSLRSKIVGSERFILSWLAVVWFDTLATLPDELLLWSSRWSLLKVFFLLNRWLGPLLQTLWAGLVFVPISPSVCQNIFWLQPTAITAVMFLSAVLMSIRVYALYSTKGVLMMLGAMVLLETAAMSAAASQFHPLLLPPGFGKIVNLPGCIAAGPNGQANALVAVFWAAPLTFDTLIVGLTLYNILVINRRAKKLPVLSNILRDGMLFYAIISVANLVNVALYAQHDQVIQNFNNPTSLALTSIMASRLVTSLRKINATQRTLHSRTSLSNLKSFPPPPPSPLEAFPPSHPRSRQPSEAFSIPRKSEEFDDEERGTTAPGGGGGGGEQVEMAAMGNSLHFRANSTSTATRSRQRRRPTNQAIVGLERLGLISPSTAVDISRPMALTSGRPPFSDVIPLDPSNPNSPKHFSRFNRTKAVSGSLGKPGEDREPSGTGGGESGNPGFAITVEREIVVSVGAHA